MERDAEYWRRRNGAKMAGETPAPAPEPTPEPEPMPEPPAPEPAPEPEPAPSEDGPDLGIERAGDA